MNTQASSPAVDENAELRDEITGQIREYLQCAGEMAAIDNRIHHETIHDDGQWSEDDDDDAIDYTG